MQATPPEDIDQLRRLSKELKRLVERLGAPVEPAPDDSHVTAPQLRSLISHRRRRNEIMGEGLFVDPAWDMLLELYAAELEGKRVSVSSLRTASAAPPSTALRWISILEARGLINRHADLLDGRRIYVSLTADASEKMRNVLSAGRSAAGLVLQTVASRGRLVELALTAAMDGKPTFR